MTFEIVPGRSFSPANRAPDSLRAYVAAERERTEGHGHGMSRNRTPKNECGLPHDADRDGKQPYAREI